MRAAEPHDGRPSTLTQQPRGGIVIEATANRATGPMSVVVTTLSGGLDSVTLAHELVGRRPRPDRAVVRLRPAPRARRSTAPPAARRATRRAEHHVVDLALGRRPADAARRSPTPAVDVPEGHYTDASMAATVVAQPQRHHAVGRRRRRRRPGAEAVATAVHAGDHTVYPDCRPEFIEAFEHEARVANEGFIADGFAGARAVPPPRQGRDRAPGRRARRARSRRRGRATVGGELHCGRCGTCVERREAFELAGRRRPHPYVGVPS